MLPNTENIANIDNLVLAFEDTEQQKTKTFKISEVNVTDYAKSCGILGVGVLGRFKLNTVKGEIEPYANVIAGMVDGVRALKQSIYLMLNIEAEQYIIYPYTYGLKTIDLIGKPVRYVMAVIPKRITETLLRDDRITNVSDFEFDVAGNKLAVKFVVHSIYGDVEGETVVMY